VTGSIAGAAIVALAILYLLRLQRRKRKQPATDGGLQEKAQLDGEGIKPKEMNDNQIRELHGDHVEPVEMYAGYTGAEMEVASAHSR
jgi:hypothetical protein